MSDNHRLVGKLYRATDRGLLSWERGGQAARFVTGFQNGSIQINKTKNSQGADLVQFLIYNRDGQLVETFDDEDLEKAADASAPPGGNGWFWATVALHEMARRNAMGSDKILRGIIAEIPDDEDDEDDL